MHSAVRAFLRSQLWRLLGFSGIKVCRLTFWYLLMSNV